MEGSSEVRAGLSPEPRGPAASGFGVPAGLCHLDLARPVLIGLAAALGAAVMFGVGSIRLAVGARRVPFADGVSLQLLRRMLRERAILQALGLNLVGFSFHLVALRSIPLFLAQTGIAASLAVTAILTVRVFGNRLTTSDWIAIAAVCLGLGLLAGASGDAGKVTVTGQADLAVVGAVVLLVVIAFGATRVGGGLGAAMVGLVAGIGFALVSISARLIPEITVTSVLSAPATFTLAISGGLAFFLYSVALQRGSVMTATAPMIVMQTATPAAVGVLLLGDTIRPGWSLAAALGVVLSGVGATALARFEGVAA
jgi:drug/metabolite transporter (DMT)-like permease